jgi:hypothetical protein
MFRDKSAIWRAIPHLVRSAAFFEAAFEVIECVLSYVDFKRFGSGFHLYPRRKE